MPDHSRFLNTKYFGSLNGLRCLSILFVILFHYASNCREFGIMGFSLQEVSFRGYLGVNLFFVISGFLITTLLLREQQAYRSIAVRSFYIRRILRIFPLYYTVLLLFIFLFPFGESSLARKEEFVRNLPYFFTYTSNWFVTNESAIFVFAWSLATEEQFYLLWPHVLNFFSRCGAVLFVVAVIVLNQTALLGHIGPLPFLSETQNFYLLRMISSISTSICLGALLAFGLHSKEVYERLAVLKHRSASVFIFLILLFCIYMPEKLTPGWTFAVNFFMMLFVGSCVYQEKHDLARVLCSKVFYQIGMVSYGMYLFHILCFYFIRHTFLFLQWKHADLEFLISLVFTFAVAYISYHYYESRFLALKKQHVR